MAIVTLVTTFDPQRYKSRRTTFIEKLPDKSLVILPNKPRDFGNFYTEFRYKPDTDFYYLTGLQEPGSICVIRKEGSDSSFTLFVEPTNKEVEIWEGKKTGIDCARDIYGATEAYPLGEFDTRLRKSIISAEHVLIPLGNDPNLDSKITKLIGELKRNNRVACKTLKAVLDPRDYIHPMRLVKDNYELACLKASASILNEAFLKAMKSAVPGVTEKELRTMLDYEFEREGEGASFATIVGAGDNAVTLHYDDRYARAELRQDGVYSNGVRQIKDGELVLIDAGCEYGFYASDSTRTLPANRKFSPEQKAIYELVLEAQNKTIDLVRQGTKFTDLYNESVSVIVDGLITLGLLKGTKQENIESGNYKKFFMHKIGHWLGLDCHDVGPYIEADGGSIKLQPNMVLTVEPGIYIQSDMDVPANFKGIGVRIEDDVVVTDSKGEVLTSHIPKSVYDLEHL